MPEIASPNSNTTRDGTALACEFVKAQSAVNVNGILSRKGLPTSDSEIDKARLDFERVGPPADALGCQYGRAGATEGVEHDGAAAGAVLDSIRHQRHRLDGRMALQVIQAPGPKRVDPGVIPNVGARTAVASQLDVVEMGCRAHAEHADELVCAAVERALSGVGLRPDH